MASETEVSNLALGILGSDLITDIDDNNSVNARRCKAALPMLIDEVLEAHTWHFAKKRANLAVGGDAVDWGWLYRYPLPTNPWCLRLIKVAAEAKPKFELNGRDVLCDYVAPLPILYVARVGLDLFSPTATNALALRLAAHICYPVLTSREREADLNKQYQDKIRDARGINAQQAPSDDDEEESDMLAARY